MDSLTFFDLYNPLCTFGGLTIQKIFKDNYREYSTICENKSAFEQIRIFYSNNSSLTIILYWVPSYIIIKILLSVRLTSCRHVTIDIYESLQRCYSESDFRNYLKHTTLFSGIMIYKYFPLKNIKQSLKTDCYYCLTVNLKNESCATLTFSINLTFAVTFLESTPHFHTDCNHSLTVNLNGESCVTLAFSINLTFAVTFLESTPHRFSDFTMFVLNITGSKLYSIK